LNYNFKIFSFAHAAYSTIRDVFPDHNYLIFDIGAEITDIFVVKGNLLVKSSDIVYGKHTLVRDLAARQKIPVASALTWLESKEQDSDFLENPKLKDNIDASLDKWIGLVSQSLKSLMQEMFIPKKCYIIARHDVSRFFADNLKKIKIEEMNQTVEFDDIVALSAHDLYTIGGKMVSMDPFIALEAGFTYKASADFFGAKKM